MFWLGVISGLVALGCLAGIAYTIYWMRHF